MRQETQEQTKVFRLIFWSIVALALFSRAYGLGRFSLWTDELYSLNESASVHAILTERGNGTLFFLLLKAWRLLFGDSPAAMRSLNVVIDVCSAMLVYAITTLITRDKRSGLAAMCLYGIAPMPLWHSRSLRMYPLMNCLILTATWSLCAYAIIAHKRRYIALYCLALAGAVLAHNYSVFFAFGLAVTAWILLGTGTVRKSKSDIRHYLNLHAPLFPLMAVVLLRLVAKTGAGFWSYVKGWSYTGYQFSVPNLFSPGLSFDATIWKAFGAQAQVLLLFILILPLPALLWMRRKGDFPPQMSKVLGTMLTLPIATVCLLPIRGDFRYVFPAVTFLIVVTGIFAVYLARIRHGRKISILFSLVVLAAHTPKIYEVYAKEPEPWKAVCDYLAINYPEKHTFYALNHHPINGLSQCKNRPENLQLVTDLDDVVPEERNPVFISRIPSYERTTPRLVRMANKVPIKNRSVFSGKLEVVEYRNL